MRKKQGEKEEKRRKRGNLFALIEQELERILSKMKGRSNKGEPRGDLGGGDAGHAFPKKEMRRKERQDKTRRERKRRKEKESRNRQEMSVIERKKERKKRGRRDRTRGKKDPKTGKKIRPFFGPSFCFSSLSLSLLSPR